jgi:hypothetical protein
MLFQIHKSVSNVMQRLSIGQITGELKKQIEEEVMHIFSTAPA